MVKRYDSEGAALDVFADAVVTGDPSGAIERQEARAQEEIVSGEAIPARCLNGTDDDLRALGIVVGDPYPDDPQFCPAVLPAGWRKEPSAHPMWSYLIDDRGFRRCAIFFKGAFYDRCSHIEITEPPEHHSAHVLGEALHEAVTEHPERDLDWPVGLDATTEHYLDAWLERRVARIRRRDTEDEAAGRKRIRYTEEAAYLRLHEHRRTSTTESNSVS